MSRRTILLAAVVAACSGSGASQAPIRSETGAGATPEASSRPAPSAAPGLSPASQDLDRDQIADGVDRCPNQPETYDGFEDQDGCPEVRRGPLRHSGPRAPLERQMIVFEARSSSINPTQHEVLETVAELLKSNTEVVRVEVQGHSEAAGGQRVAQRRSEERARAVTEALIKRGIERERLVVVGYAASRPIDQNRSERDRRLAGRVEFRILECRPTAACAE